MSFTSPLTAASLLLAAALTFASGPAPAATKVASPAQAEPAGPTDFSAHRYYRRKVYVHRRYGHPGYYGYRYYGAAPSFGFIGGPDGYPGEYAWRRSLGQCVHDLGYGRWKAC